MADVDALKVYAVMPSTIAIELLDGSFELLLKRADGRKGEVVDVDFKTSQIAREIRNRFTRKTRDKDKLLELPDCIYVAAAIRYHCEALITRDGECNRRHNLLNVADEVFAAYKVKILHPKDAIDQQVMVFPSNETDVRP